MKVRKCIRVLLTVLLFVLLSMGCAKAGHLGEKTSNGGEYLANVLSGEISEMKFIGGGETITLTERSRPQWREWSNLTLFARKIQISKRLGQPPFV